MLRYEISEIEPYINWLYFFHAWGLSGKPQAEKERMQHEALELLHSWQGKYHTHAIFGLFSTNSDGDDLVLSIDEHPAQTHSLRIPMLRQQHPTANGQPYLCLADFIRPAGGGIEDKVGAFCTTVDREITELYRHDEY